MEEIKSGNFIEQGWQCPVCKAVMSPRERMCINCRGITLYGTTTTFPETSQYVDVNQFHKSTSDLQATTISSEYKQNVRDCVTSLLDKEFNEILKK